MSFCVYKHTAPSGKIYIGITSQKPTDRWGNGCNYVANKYFYRAIKKYGWNSFRHEILFEGLTKEEAEKKEIQLIQSFDATNPLVGFNSRKGGSVCSFSAEAIERMSRSHLGRPNTPEQRKKISESLKGRKISKGTLGFQYSEESRRRMSAAQRGKRLSDETKLRIIRSRTGVMTGAANHRSKRVQNIDTGEIFESQGIAAKKMGICQSDISLCCQGRKKAVKGTRWRFYTEKEA